jgi:hypothetical protein
MFLPIKAGGDCQMLLLVIALFGLIVPNGIFIYWLLNEFNGIDEVVQNKLAAAFIIDAVMAMLLLAYWFAVKPIGRIKWHWFIALSLVGGLGFSIPFYWWLNQKFGASKEKTT